MPNFGPLFANRPQRVGLSIEERFSRWREANPKAVELMRRLALEAVRSGRKRIGIAALVERARWEMDLSPTSEGWKWNNTYRALLSRWLMETTPELKDAFETRELRSA